jgi:hypothetical protein
MKLSIFPKEGIVAIDGVAVDVEVNLPTIHAIQWDGERGHIEYAPDATGERAANSEITSIAPYQVYIDLFKKQKKALDDARISNEIVLQEKRWRAQGWRDLQTRLTEKYKGKKYTELSKEDFELYLKVYIASQLDMDTYEET